MFPAIPPESKILPVINVSGQMPQICTSQKRMYIQYMVYVNNTTKKQPFGKKIGQQLQSTKNNNNNNNNNKYNSTSKGNND
jgi:hypothetical protein